MQREWRTRSNCGKRSSMRSTSGTAGAWSSSAIPAPAGRPSSSPAGTLAGVGGTSAAPPPAERTQADPKAAEAKRGSVPGRLPDAESGLRRLRGIGYAAEVGEGEQSELPNAAVTGYYAQKLAGRRLQQCYEIASPRVQQCLEAEIRHVLGRLGSEDRVLEMGCGYGRVALRLAEVAADVVGIDNAVESLELAHQVASKLDPIPHCEFLLGDAANLPFLDGAFDTVVCIQNGISAFRIDSATLLLGAMRVTRPGGQVLLSSYADRFWPHRLSWFEAQADLGLLGPIDRDASGDGLIVCRDGFRSGRMTPQDFEDLCDRLGVAGTVSEVDGSSVFCAIVAPAASE